MSNYNYKDILEEIAFQLERIADALEDKGDGGEPTIKPEVPKPTPPSPTTPAPLPSGYYCLNCGQWVMTGTFHQCNGRRWPNPYQYFCSRCGMKINSGGYHVCSGRAHSSGGNATWTGPVTITWNTNLGGSQS